MLGSLYDDLILAASELVLADEGGEASSEFVRAKMALSNKIEEYWHMTNALNDRELYVTGSVNGRPA